MNTGLPRFQQDFHRVPCAVSRDRMETYKLKNMVIGILADRNPSYPTRASEWIHVSLKCLAAKLGPQPLPVQPFIDDLDEDTENRLGGTANTWRMAS